MELNNIGENMGTTKASAIHSFFSSFGIPAYPTSALADEKAIPYPYLTYEAVSGAFPDGEANIIVNLWYYTSSEVTPNKKAEEISKRLGQGGSLIKCDDGYIWVKRGQPFCQSLTDANDAGVKRRYININIEFLTF